MLLMQMTHPNVEGAVLRASSFLDDLKLNDFFILCR